MNKQMLILSKKYIPYNYQIVIIEFDKKNTLPNWISGNEKVVFGEKGFIIATSSEEEILVEVYTSFPQEQNDNISFTGWIKIGKKGLGVGSIIGGNIDTLSLKKGSYLVHLNIDYRSRILRIYLLNYDDI